MASFSDKSLVECLERAINSEVDRYANELIEERAEEIKRQFIQTAKEKCTNEAIRAANFYQVEMNRNNIVFTIRTND